MKKEIMMLIIGILIGAIIATGVFLVLNNSNNNNSTSSDMPASMEKGDTEGAGGTPPDMDGNFTGGGMQGEGAMGGNSTGM